MPGVYSVMMPLGGIFPKRTGYLFRRNQHHHLNRRGIQLFEKLMGCGPEFFERRHSICLGRCSPPLRNTYSSMNGVPPAAVIPNGRTAGQFISKPTFYRSQSYSVDRNRLMIIEIACAAEAMAVSMQNGASSHGSYS